MNTPTTILLTQIPIAIGIIWGAYELKETKKELIKLLNLLSKIKRK